MKMKASILSSSSLFLSFVTNNPMAENALSGSTDVSLIVSKVRYSFSGLLGLFILKKSNFLFHNWHSDLFLC